LDEETNLELKKINSDIPNSSSLVFLIKKLRYKSILIRTDNTAAIFNINKKSGAINIEDYQAKIDCN
jgi:hypothetical protein